MSIAPLCMKVDSVKFDDKEVVKKSYPNFWKDIQNVGIKCIGDDLRFFISYLRINLMVQIKKI